MWVGISRRWYCRASEHSVQCIEGLSRALRSLAIEFANYHYFDLSLLLLLPPCLNASPLESTRSVLSTALCGRQALSAV